MLQQIPFCARALCLPLLAGLAAAQSGDWVIPAGQVVQYRTGPSKVIVNSLRIEPGAVLRVVGKYEFHVVAQSIEIDGTLDASGWSAQDVATLGTGNLVEQGALGAAGGGRGGSANKITSSSTPQGDAGFGVYDGFSGLGGGGGESGFDATSSSNVDKRRGAGGGGGAFGPDVVGGGVGLVAAKGANGGPTATGCVTGLQPPKGGAIAPRAFVDANPDNDFFGQKPFLPGLPPIVGELAYPRPGVGGGAGGNSCAGPTFPTPVWTPNSDEKGAGGGGGGGLLIAEAQTVRIGLTGRIVANGGSGASGENTLALNHVGAGSGGGSGGMIVIQANALDLSQAAPGVFEARGGKGGAGLTSNPTSVGSGGDGGPGLVQVHAVNGASVAYPPAYASPIAALQALSVPPAHLLLPVALL
ncbi:MAG: hypothetical protein EPO68_08480 [Planctomycetota bacterium]|nr:MAG: hypothetical protein EPO68_08480 [Planctomycetota bacterium]